tara:strand:- start:3114 stop:4532 length:1419 start_codon:yes stop_codon:yes gene_type:complete
MNVKKIIIAGGGTAGLAAALILRARFEKIDIKIIKSDRVGIVGVGEGTSEHWSEFMSVCNIKHEDLIREADATFKFGVMFKDWTPKPYLHFVDNDHRFTIGQYDLFYAYCIANNISFNDIMSPFLKRNLINKNVRCNLYHFNTYKLNQFLIKKCKERNIKVIDDEIIDVVHTDKIESLKGIKKTYKADFYFDCTGFKKLLISKLGGKWKSFNLIMNEGMAFNTNDENNYSPWTLAQAMNAGWLWRIPTYNRSGNGYIYNSNYITREKAQQEVEKLLGHPIKIEKFIKFDDGYLERPWIKNCMAIGLSALFAEPLEASAIGASVQQTFCFCNYISNYTEKEIDSFNKQWQILSWNIRNFVAIHYLVKGKNTSFWKNERITFSDDFQEKLNTWKRRLPITQDFQTRYLNFHEINHIYVLEGINHFNRKDIAKEISLYSASLHKQMRVKYLNQIKTETRDAITIKEYLDRIHNGY